MDLPLRLLRPFLGARILKTGIAVFIALAGFAWVGHDYAVFSAVAAILAVQPSLQKAKETFIHQLLGNLTGGLIGVGLALWVGNSPVAVAFGVVVLLGVLVKLGLTDAANIGVVVLLFVMESTHQDLFLYIVARVGAVTGGMFIGFLVNRYIRPPRFSARLREELQEAGRETDAFMIHLMESLSAPEFYQKEQIKQESAAIVKRLDTVRYLLDVSAETEAEDPMRPALIKANASLFVFTTGIAEVHKVVLRVGGLSGSEYRGRVARALEAVMRFRQEAMAAALEGRHPIPGAGADFDTALSDLERLIHAMVDDPKRRSLGLALYTIHGHIQHMGHRMRRLAAVIPPQFEKV